MEQTNWADVGIMALFLISTLIGIYRGFLREILSLVTWIVAGIIAVTYGQEVGDFISAVQSDKMNYIIGVTVIFFGILLIGASIKFLICKACNLVGAKPLDRLVGGLFGALRATVLVLIVMVVGANNISGETWYKESVLIPQLQWAADIIVDNMPVNWRNDLNQEVRNLRNGVSDN